MPLPSEQPIVEVLSHDLKVELEPMQHRLTATDRTSVKALVSSPSPSFILNTALHVTDLRIFNEKGTALPILVNRSDEGNSIQRITIASSNSLTVGQVFVVEWTYDGEINDPPREPRHLRFVTPSETAGHIGPEGVYLSGETHWYPDLPGALPTFRIQVTTPVEWLAVTHGRQTSQATDQGKLRATWDVMAKTEALTLVSNRFVYQRRDWHGIEIATYLFPEDEQLAQEYLDASIRYLDTYSKLLGPYPFPKFAVVENFFASGLGMPSFTLLGSSVIKRRYIQPYALGHEIVHSWIGNWVLNRADRGNWVEGLTTYLSNYYYEELTGTSEQALDQRRLMMLGYALYVRPEEDYPVGRFTQKSDQKDNAIGYQKAAMVFHMLRHEIGDDAFWTGLRQLVGTKGGAYADWQDLEHVFSIAGQTDLRWFFSQWVSRVGAPILRLQEARIQKSSASNNGPTTLNVKISQTAPSFRLTLPIRVEMSDGRKVDVRIPVESTEENVAVPFSGQPVRVLIDPASETFRRLERQEIPPMLNLYVTDRDRAVVLPSRGTADEQALYRELATRVAAQDSRKTVSITADGERALEGSILVLGGPEVNRRAEWAVSGCRDRVSLRSHGVVIDHQTFQGDDIAVLISCRHPEFSDRVVTLFYGLSPAAAAKVARLLFFYGWQSYLVFQNGKVIARGNFSAPQSSLEVKF